MVVFHGESKQTNGMTPALTIRTIERFVLFSAINIALKMEVFFFFREKKILLFFEQNFDFVFEGSCL